MILYKKQYYISSEIINYFTYLLYIPSNLTSYLEFKVSISLLIILISSFLITVSIKNLYSPILVFKGLDTIDVRFKLYLLN